MPYKIQKDGEKFQVVNADTGKVMGTHPDEAKAKAQMAALYANVEDAGKSIADLLAAKMGRRNSGSDAEKLKQIQILIADLLSGEEAEPDENKHLNLSYAKSLNIALPDLAVKSIGKDEIQFYSNLWGDANQTDLEAEYFTKSTDFWDSVLPSIKVAPRPLTWDHAQDAETKSNPVIGQCVDMGDDKVGRWMVAKLDAAHRYRKAIDGLIEKKAIGASSDSAPQYVIREKTGKATFLKRWPLFAVALTEMPCEPRMVGTVTEYLKSFGFTLPAPDALLDEVRLQREKANRLFNSINLHGV